MTSQMVWGVVVALGFVVVFCLLASWIAGIAGGL